MKKTINLEQNSVYFEPECLIDAYRLGKLAGKIKPLSEQYCDSENIFAGISFKLSLLIDNNIPY